MTDALQIQAILSTHGYELLDGCGQGGFARCFKVRDPRYDQIFVCKLIEISDNMSNGRIESAQEQYYNEIEALKLIWHSNVIRFYNNFVHDNLLFVILEYCPNGSVTDLLNRPERINSQKLGQLALQLANAIEICHANYVAHHDIKPDNVLFDEYNYIRLADFGMATINEGISTKFAGSPCFMAPEVCNGNPYDPFAADVWSFGATLVLMATGMPSFNGMPSTKAQLLLQSGEISIPKDVRPEIIFIIKKTFVRDPENRWTISQVCNYLRSTISTSLQGFSKAGIVVPRLSKAQGSKNFRKSLPTLLTKFPSQKILRESSVLTNIQ